MDDVVAIAEFVDDHSNHSVGMIRSNIDALDFFASVWHDNVSDSPKLFEPNISIGIQFIFIGIFQSQNANANIFFRLRQIIWLKFDILSKLVVANQHQCAAEPLAVRLEDLYDFVLDLIGWKIVHCWNHCHRSMWRELDTCAECLWIPSVYAIALMNASNVMNAPFGNDQHLTHSPEWIVCDHFLAVLFPVAQALAAALVAIAVSIAYVMSVLPFWMLV